MSYLEPRFVRNAWYVAAWSDEVPTDKPFARTVLGEPVVLYRRADKTIVALADKCCHRAAPLSHGRIEGDNIRCMYHGMRFAPNGACNDIPGQSEIPERACVRAFPVIERDRFIWIWMGPPERADPSTILSFFWHTDSAWRLIPGYLHYQAHYQLIVDNLLDFSHLSFVHPTTLGTASNAETKAQVEHADGGLRITRWYLNDEMSPNHRRVATFDGKVDRWQIYTWHAPAFMRMDAGSAPVGTGAPEGARVASALQFRHTSVQTPETANTTHYFFCQAHNFGHDNPELTQTIFNDVRNAFDEDRAIIEAQQRVLNTSPDFKPVATAHDMGLNQARFLTKRMLDAETTS